MRRLCPIPMVLLLILLVAGRPSRGDVSDTQERETEQVQPEVEQWLRNNLRKLERWGVTQLMRTEQSVDRQQKRRANASTNPAELGLLADDEDRGVRFFVAANRYTPLDTRIQLASDPEATVRSGVAMSLAYEPLASPTARQVVEGIALELARDPNVLVRLALAANKQLPPAVFAVLGSDPDFIIRRKLVDNIHVPRRVLGQLAADSVLAVRTAALSHRNTPLAALQQAAADSNVAIRRAVCRNMNAPLGLLDSLASDPDPEVRRLTAAHPNTPIETLRRLTRDRDVDVLLAVARHPRADRSILTDLAYDDRDPRVRLAAQDRLQPMLRREIRDDIMERWQVSRR